MSGSGSAGLRRLGATTAALIVLAAGACENPQPPAACGAIPQVTVNAGEQATVAACFNDPNEDMLTYSVSSANPSVATASMSGTTVTVSAIAPGNASVTVTASDPGGLQGQQSFQVMVPNRPPLARGTISSITVHVGQTESVDASSYFTEPDGEALTYGATSSNPAVATVSVSGSTVRVTAVAKGTTNVTVTATDPGGLAATQTFQTMVPNRQPEPVGTISDQTVEVGETATVDLSPYFEDPDGDALTYTARSSNSGVARASVSGSTLTITAVAKGTTNVTVTATDPEGLEATQTFRSTVPNRPPGPTGTIPDQTVHVGETVTVDLSPYFEDPDGDALTYEAVSSDPATAGVAVFGDTVAISGVARGQATITVTATDQGGLTAQSAFPVDVIGNDGGSFRIELVFATEMTSAQESAFRDAAERWMSILAETELPDREIDGTVDCGGEYEQSVGTIDDLMIVAAVVEIDGPGGTLGRASPCWIRSDTGLPFFGMMEFDVADLESLENNGTMRPVILHEMGHVLGIGTLWEYFDLLRNPSSANEALDTHFAGRLAIEAFDSAGVVGYTGGGKVPVENLGGPGTRNGHWRASVFGNELMIRYLGETTPLSAITIQSLADLGYKVDASQADAYRLPDAAALASMLENSIDLGNDVLRVPIVVVDRNGLIVRVIPPN